MMFVKRKNKQKNTDSTVKKSKLTEQSVLFLNEIVLRDFSVSVPLTSDDFLSLCEFVRQHYEIGLLDDNADNSICGFENVHAKAVQFTTECSNNEIDLDDLNLRLIQNNA